MSDARGYDDQFNDGVFRVALRNTRVVRPPLWPQTMTQMRRHVVYEGPAAYNFDSVQLAPSKKHTSGW